jgi:murein DD-endopeptidase MepM/ murein hydrolase activator NlpD
MTRRLLLCFCCLALVLSSAAARAQELVRKVGRVAIRVDLSQAFPGGVAVVRLGGARVGAAWALLDGRRAPFYSDHGVPRALVPIAASAVPGPATLGVEIAARRREQRILIPVQIAARAYPVRGIVLAEPARALLARAEVAHDARRLLGHVRTESSTRVPGPLAAPVAATGAGFGELRTLPGAGEAESRIDALAGERHRGLDYAVPVGTAVRAPGGGGVVFAGALVLSGETVVIDHGQGVVSVLQHLSRLSVREGDTVAAGAEVGLSGDSGLASTPGVQWRVYLHGIAVDPRVLAPILG